MPELTPSTLARRDQRASVRLQELAEGRWGVASLGELVASGIDADRITRWIRDARLFRIYPGVYAIGRPSLSIEGRLAAALLYAGPESALSHTTAGWWWGLLETEPRRIHVSTLGRSRSAGDIGVHHPRRLPRTTHRGLSVTTVPRTLLDLAAVLSLPQLRRALAEADHRQRLNVPAVEAVLGRGRPGSAALRKALEIHLPELAQTLSVLEERFLALCDTYGIKLPEVNATVSGLMVDALWREERVVAELDGGVVHGTPAAVKRDRGREMVLRTAGFRVLRYSWWQVDAEPECVAADLKAALLEARPNWSQPVAPGAT